MCCHMAHRLLPLLLHVLLLMHLAGDPTFLFSKSSLSPEVSPKLFLPTYLPFSCLLSQSQWHIVRQCTGIFHNRLWSFQHHCWVHTCPPISASCCQTLSRTVWDLQKCILLACHSWRTSGRMWRMRVEFTSSKSIITREGTQPTSLPGNNVLLF